jgi:tripartite-type tricarboxylate transporter receptor subunit TctC
MIRWHQRTLLNVSRWMSRAICRPGISDVRTEGVRGLRGVALLLACSTTAMAQTFPAKPIRMIVPAAAAGPTDLLARVATDHLAKAFGQALVVENMASAGGNVGLQAAARSAPDGYTIFIASQSMIAMGPFLYEKLPFDHENDFTPVMVMAAPPYVLVVNPGVAATNLNELLALLRSQPGKLNFASTGGIGSTSHVVGELFKRVGKVDIVHVPYKGDAQATGDLIGGQVQMMFTLSAGATPHIRGGKVRPIAIGSLKRSSALPDIPTFDESGLPGFTAASWFAIMTRAGVPAPIVTRLNEELNRMLQLPEVRARLLSVGAEPAGGTVAEATAFVRAERAKWGQVIREAAIKLN